MTRSTTWHHHGLNFSRSWGLWALSEANAPGDAKDTYRNAYAAHFRATYDTPALWCGSYQGVGHWVPQFGMLALQPLFEMKPYLVMEDLDQWVPLLGWLAQRQPLHIEPGTPALTSALSATATGSFAMPALPAAEGPAEAASPAVTPAVG